jgi:hypothetical protein
MEFEIFAPDPLLPPPLIDAPPLGDPLHSMNAPSPGEGPGRSLIVTLNADGFPLGPKWVHEPSACLNRNLDSNTGSSWLSSRIR